MLLGFIFGTLRSIVINEKIKEALLNYYNFNYFITEITLKKQKN